MERWVVVGDDAVIEQLSETAWAVFNNNYWDSAVLGPIDMAVYNLLRQNVVPLSTTSLVESLVSDADADQRDSLSDYCVECLRQMETLGLVYAVDRERA
ncbi:hypothetical protein Enr13x_31100 [Stieleria neptunia]|uniref:Coenzyme PQQ synthesis protein D (PqqD) n=1 Tax=Stieleria neptunia TaxID=2527979 RepID=A0A518HQY2_9BACT|nr:hypothetical protein [Stieleria neptunia]QDV43255.1 hypothetical protein Enr13x_31100 [Stieleria neptunia]